MKLFERIKYVITDFVKYIDTSIPQGVKSKEYTDLKYTTQEKLMKFEEEYDLFPRRLIEMKATQLFLSVPDEKKLEYLRPYME